MHFSIIFSQQPNLFTQKNPPFLFHFHTNAELPSLPSRLLLTQNTHVCTLLPQTHRTTHGEIHSRERRLHYTGITKRNVLIKWRGQLQTARRENGNDVVHQALKKEPSGGQRMCTCSFLFIASSCGGLNVFAKDADWGDSIYKSNIIFILHIFTFRHWHVKLRWQLNKARASRFIMLDILLSPEP